MAECRRVLYVIDSLAPGGAETSLADTAPYLMDAGLALDVAYFVERTGVGPQLTAAGAQLHHVAAPRAVRARAIRQLADRIQPDLVHTALFEADVSGRVGARLARRPVISSLVTTGFELPPLSRLAGIRARAAAAADAATAQLCVGFHAVSEPVADAMSRRLMVPRSRITVIPRGRNPVTLGRRDEDRRRHEREQLGLSHVPVVVAVGRHALPKGHVTLVDALADVVKSVPDAVLLLAGQLGEQTAAIFRRIEMLGLGDHVRVLGHRADVPSLLCAADVIAHPSTREGFPGALVEALALECPIVASDLPSIRAVVDVPTGTLASLVPVGDARALAAAIVATLNDPGRADRARAGRTHFEQHFTTAAVASRTKDFYDNIVGPGLRAEHIRHAIA